MPRPRKQSPPIDEPDDGLLKAEEIAEVKEDETPLRKRSTPEVEAFDFTEPDLFLVENKDPDYFYYHARDEALNVQKWKRRGFEMVSGASGEKTESNPIAIDGSAHPDFLNIPGHVLMRCKKDLNDERVRRNRDKFEAIPKKERENLELQSRMLKRMGSKMGLKFEEKTGYDQ